MLRLDYRDERDLWQLLADCDVCVSLRWPTMGETSGMAIRALSLGKPLVVSDVGWFSELPDSVAAKVPVDELEVETLAAMLERLAEDDELRRRDGRGRARSTRAKSTTSTASPISTWPRSRRAAAGTAVRDAVLRDVARAAQEVGIDTNDPELERRRRASAREVGLGN